MVSMPPPLHPSLKRLTQAEMQEHRSKGLCFSCDERFLPGHRRKAKQFPLLMPDDDLDDSPPPSFLALTKKHRPQLTPLPSTTLLPTKALTLLPPPPDHPDSTNFHLLVSALDGSLSPSTFCLTGSILGHPLSILVDLGSCTT
ncbi:hypothetical protein Scep_017293 [Stephania cephalantha]|uniref:Uncharacterized protein n=1 Tax=Stephania cephalantha TaxID=152367 RepID=A0AAP0NVJ1_9MAGN